MSFLDTIMRTNPITAPITAPIEFAKLFTAPKELSQEQRKFSNSFKSLGLYLYNAGFPANILPYVSAQVIYESGNFTSHVSIQDHNFSGIKYVGQQFATRGTRAPERDSKGRPTYYARYSSFTDWARDFKRILSRGGRNSPLYASSLKDYVTRLYNNHYFTGSPTAYYTALDGIINNAGVISSRQNSEIQMAERKQKELEDEANSMPLWAKIGLFVFGGILVIKVVEQ